MSKRYLLSLLIATLLLLPLLLTGCGGVSLFGPPTATPLPFYRVAEQESRRQPSLLLASGFGSLILALVAGLVLWRFSRIR